MKLTANASNNGHLNTCPCSYREGVQVSSQPILKPAQEGWEVVSITLRPLYSRERPGAHCAEAWVLATYVEL